jgi:hypothetical protein
VTDPLDLLWASFDTEAPVYSGDVVASLPDGAFAWLVGNGFVEPTANASHVACPSCPNRHVEEVVTIEGTDGRRQFAIPCPESIQVTVSDDLIRQWRPNYKALARQVRECLGAGDRARERVDDRLWRVGTAKTAGKKRDIYIARGLNWPGGLRLLSRCTGKRPILLTGLAAPPPEVFVDASPAVVPLPALTVIRGGDLDVDVVAMMELIAESDEALKRKGGGYALLERHITSVVERCLERGPVTSQIADGLRDGLSTREIESKLAGQGTPLDHSNVARHIQRAKALVDPTTLKSSSSVLRSDSSQPRDSKARPIRNAQPKQEE